MVQVSHLYMTTLAPRTGISTQKVLKKQLLDEKRNKPGIMKAWLEFGCFFFFLLAGERGVEKTLQMLPIVGVEFRSDPEDCGNHW